jgi:hypothetical protein
MLIKVSFDTVFILIISFQGKHSKSCVCVCVCCDEELNENS